MDDIGARTEANLHLAFELVRTKLVSNPQSSGYRGNHLHVVVLSDGGVWNKEGTARASLSTALANATYSSETTTLWAFGIGSNVDSETIKSIDPKWDKRMDVDDDTNHTLVADYIVLNADMCEKTTAATSATTTTGTTSISTTLTSTSATTTMTTTTGTSTATFTITSSATTSATSTPCHEQRADLVFVLDTSASTTVECKSKKPIRSFTSSIVRSLGELVRPDAVRVAAVIYNNTASVLFNFNDYIDDRAGLLRRLRKFNVAPGFPTLAHTAYETVAEAVLVKGGINGFRHSKRLSLS